MILGCLIRKIEQCDENMLTPYTLYGQMMFKDKYRLHVAEL